MSIPPRVRPRRTVHDMPTGVPFCLRPAGGPAYRRVFSGDGRTWLRALDDDRLVLVMLPFPVYPADPGPGEED